MHARNVSALLKLVTDLGLHTNLDFNCNLLCIAPKHVHQQCELQS